MAETRSFEEQVASTIPNSKYDYVIENILRDKEYGWSLNYYKPDGKSSYDVGIARMTNEIKELTANIVTNEKLMKTLDQNISNSSHKKIQKSQLETWDKQFVLAEEEIRNDTHRIQEIQNLLPKWEWNRYLELGRESSLQHVRNSFMIDNNMEQLAKGVTWACSYDSKHRCHIDFGCDDTLQQKQSEEISAF